MTAKFTKKPTTTSRAKKTQSVLDAVKNLTPDIIVNEVGALQVSLQGTLANISASITEKIEKMHQVDEAISLKEDRISELYEIEQEALNLEDVKSKRSLEEAEWLQSRNEKRKQWLDEESERNQKWQRESEEYAYKTKVERDRKMEEFEAEVVRLKREETLRHDRLASDWADREKDLVEKENEIHDLRAKVDAHEENVKKQVAQAEAILGNKMKSDYEHKLQLLEKDNDSERKLYAAKVEALENTITSLSEQLDEAQVLLESTRRDAKEVTERALESASGRQVASALQGMHQSNTLKK